LEGLDNRLQSLNCQLLQLSSEKRSALVVVVNLLELLIIVLKVCEIDVGNIDIRVSSLFAMLLKSFTASAEGKLVDLVL
jgi:hypothetical protein